MAGGHQCASAHQQGLTPFARDEIKWSKAVSRELFVDPFNQGLHGTGANIIVLQILKLWAMGCRRPPDPVLDASLTKNLRTDWQKCNSHHSTKKRLSTWQWNCGGISSHRLDEVKAWLVMSHIDLAILVGTRMTFDATCTNHHWHILHSGEGEHRGKGIMILILDGRSMTVVD